MKEKVADEDDELRSHYDLKSLRVRKLDPGRMKFGSFSNIDDLMDSLAHD